jgi:DNA-binding transcriptional MocR family regulator
LADLSQINLDVESGVPLYRQLADAIRTFIEHGSLRNGERLPATRELASQLRLNRATVSAAYNMLEQSGILQGHVGRGSFVAKESVDQQSPGQSLDWDSILSPLEFPSSATTKVEINLASSRPAGAGFPLAAFRRLTKEVIDSPEAENILQLGSPHGYNPLRAYLTDQAISEGVARGSDDLLMTNGCQQALDLVARLFFAADRGGDTGRSVALESPVYHGLLRVFARTGAHIVPVTVDEHGIDPDALEAAIVRSRPRLIVVTPSFQNPMGTTMSLERRKRVLVIAQRTRTVLIENDIYSELRYRGKALPTLKQLDTTGNVILLRSYSKVSFPGLRVGWVIGPRPFIARLAEGKEICDLHSDQLSQAVLLRFAQSGELAKHLSQTRVAGLQRLEASLSACDKYLPKGSSFTRPDGGMCHWVNLPAPLNAENVLARAEKLGVRYLPGSLFSSRPAHRRGLRVSFGGLTPEQITRGIKLISQAASEELRALDANALREPVSAVV